MPDGIYDKAVIAQGLHLLPFRTEKLNLVTSMVLLTRESRKPPPYKTRTAIVRVFFFVFIVAKFCSFPFFYYFCTVQIVIFRHKQQRNIHY